MTQSKTVFVERPQDPVVAPGTVVLFARDNQLYMKTEDQYDANRQSTCGKQVVGAVYVSRAEYGNIGFLYWATRI